MRRQAQVFTLVVLLAVLRLAPAQQITGSLTGIVMDSTGAVIPNAQITMTNELSGDVRRTTTNQEGYFSIQGVFPGSYTVQVEASGFNIYRVEKINFSPGDKRTLPNITLTVAPTGTEVQVVATTEELIPLETGEKAVVITQQQLQDVAVVGRSAAEFVKILPGMAFISNGVENRPGFNGENIGINGNGDGGKQSAIGNFSANGTRSFALDITADGAHVSDPGCNCATPINPNADMIAEFKVQQSNFGAENAKGPVVMSSITKAGGREFHGSAYLYARHFALNSNDWLNNRSGAKRPENKYFFPGATIGGPVLIPGTNFNRGRDKMFFFTGFEYFRQTIDTGLLRSVVPTQAMRNGDFTDTAYINALRRAAPNAIAADNLGPEFPGNRIPASQIDPGMRSLLNLVPEPNTDPAGIGEGFNWVRVLTLDQNMWQSLSRVDYSISDYTKLFVRYNRQNELQPFPIQLWWRNAGAVPLPTPIEGRNQADSVSTSLTKVFSPTLTNEFVFGYTFVDFPNSYQDYNKMRRDTNNFPYRGIFKQDDKIPGFLSWAGPIAGMWLTGGFDPVLFATKHLVTISDNVSKIKGTHTMKFGGYYGHIVNKQPGNEPSAGAIFFSPWHANTTGNVLADMVRGAADSYSEATLAINRNMGWKEFAFYAQDSWKVTPRLTLEYGMRFQHMQPWTARNGIGIATWVQSQYDPNAPAQALPGIDWHARNRNVPLAGWDTRALFYAPRAGFAWDIFGKGNTVIRGGFGTFVYHDPQLAAGAMDLPAGLRAINRAGGVFLRDVDAIQAEGTPVFDVGTGVVDPTDDRQPTTHSWSFTVSQRLPGRILWEVAYVGNKTDHLINEGDIRNINNVPLGAMLNDPQGDPNQYRPLRQYQTLNLNTHNFYSNYHSLQTSLVKQTGIVNYTLAYTWSKAMGIVSGGALVDRLNRDNNYGPLAFDRTHLLSATYVVNVPDLYRGGSGFGKGVGNGWQISGIVQASSGVNLQGNTSPNFNMFAFLNPADPSNNAGISGPAITGTNAINAQPILTCNPRSGLQSGQYINPKCFAPPIAGTGGRPGVNGSLIFPLLRGPAFFNADISVFKNFNISEHKRLQFRFSAYNFPNHPVRSFVNGDQNLVLAFDRQGQVTNPRFGFADSKVGRRIVQLAVKFFF
jgi:hypothetical protein